MKSQKKSSRSLREFKHLIVHVTSVKHLGDYRLRLTFDDGVSKELDLWPYLENKGGVFKKVKNKEFFSQVRIDPEAGTIVWPNGADWAPDVLYQL